MGRYILGTVLKTFGPGRSPDSSTEQQLAHGSLNLPSFVSSPSSMQHSNTSLVAAIAHVVAHLPAAPNTSPAAEEHLARRHAATRSVRPTPPSDKPQSDLNLFSSSRLSLESTPRKSPSMSPPSKSRPARRVEAPGTIARDLRALRKASCSLCLDVEKTLLPIM